MKSTGPRLVASVQQAPMTQKKPVPSGNWSGPAGLLACQAIPEFVPRMSTTATFSKPDSTAGWSNTTDTGVGELESVDRAVASSVCEAITTPVLAVWWPVGTPPD